MTQVLRMFTSLLLLLGCSLLSHGVFAVQLGDLQLQSALNQPLSGEFTLRRSEGFAINELTVELAPEADFKRLGVERIAALNDLKFNVRARGSGDYVVEVTSSMPVVDPFLDFVVQARWPAGRVLRIYTALLDPLAVPTRSDSTRQAAEGKPAPVTSPGADAAAYGPVTRGDTLWSIASHLKTSLGVTVHQAMLALQRANPGAFGNNNVNLLKNGHVLRIPDLHEFRVYSPEEAFAEVRRQYREYGIVDLPDWQRGAQGSSGTRVETASGDELRLTRADRSNVDQTGPDNPGSEPGNTDTRSDSGAIKESLDELQRANQTLTNDVKALSTQIETLNKLVVLKDDQIVALEGELQKLQKPQKSQTAPTGTTAIWAWPGEKALGEFTASLDEFFKEFELDEFFKEFELNEFFKESELDEFFKESELSVLVQDPLLASGAVLLLLLVLMLMYWLVLLNRRPARSRVPLSTGPGTPMLRVSARDDWEELIRAVDLHLAYGRFDEAAQLLGQGMKAEPENTDIMLRLLEVYQRQGDVSAFSRQLERLRQTGDEYAIEQALVLEQAMTSSDSPDESAEAVPDDESVVPAQADVAGHSAVDRVEEGSGKPDAEAEKGPAAQSSAESHAEGHAHAGSKIDLARAYIEMGDEDRARALLQAVLSYGIEPDVTEAKALLARLA